MLGDRARNRSSTLAVLVAGILVALGAPARADEPTAERRAVELFERSEQRYTSGKFEEALALLLDAYQLDPAPVLLYDIGRCHEALGDLDKAIDAYERFLATSPPNDDRQFVERRVAVLRRQIAERTTLVAQHRRELGELARQQELARVTIGEQERRAAMFPPKVTLAASGAVLLAGVGFGIAATLRHQDAVRARDQRSSVDDQNQARSFATAADACFVAGGTIAAAAVVWLVVAAGKRPLQPSSKLFAIAPGAPAALTFSFR